MARSRISVGDVQIGPQRGGGKESRDHRVQARGHGGPLARQLAHQPSRHHAKVLAQLGQIPALAAKDAHPHPRLGDGIELAGHGQDQRGFAAAVRPQNRHMLPGANGQVHIVQHHAVAARHVHLAQFKKLARLESPMLRSGSRSFRPSTC